MSARRLSDISVRVEGGASKTSSATGTIGGGLIAIMREIAEMLERLALYDEPGSIDLRTLPFSPTDYQSLREALGNGEVEITLNVDGISRLRETGYAGVWWVEHRNPEDELVADLLEIIQIPEIVVTENDEIARSASRLRERLSIHTAGGIIQ
ncbi:MAG TPA: hydrogenase expression/formation C-terminal domain-containing protein [Gammaproteobacteria bacterium]|nr:hydrogenase expression/formation C-terminal domain-containing protein [Gammaproteobacteria bacterium]